MMPETPPNTFFLAKLSIGLIRDKGVIVLEVMLVKSV